MKGSCWGGQCLQRHAEGRNKRGANIDNASQSRGGKSKKRSLDLLRLFLRRKLNIKVLEGGCLGRGWFVFHIGNHENHGNHETENLKQPCLNTVNSSIVRNHENQETIFLKTTP